MFWNSFISSHLRATRPQQAGFGLIELMVSISIMIIVVSIVLASQASFNSAILLRSQTFDVALDVREVQLSAVSAIGIGGDFRERIGVFFDVGTPNSYQVFRDIDGDGVLGNSGEAYGPARVLDGRFEISDIRVGGSSVNEVAVIFERPNFDASFHNAAGDPIDQPDVKIDIKRVGAAGNTCGGEVRTLEITRTGQISVVDC